MFLLCVAVIPSIIIGIIIYKLDKVEKEPKRQLFHAFLMGIVAAVLTLALSRILGIMDKTFPINLKETLLWSFIYIALVEEFLKWGCTYLFIRNNKNFNYLFDGIVYAVFVALGFATLENIFYVTSTNLTVGLMRAVTTVPAHAIFGICIGYYLSMARYNTIRKDYSKMRNNLICSIVFPVALHGFFNFCLFMNNDLYLYIFYVFVVLLYVLAYNRLKNMKLIDKPFDK